MIDEQLNIDIAMYVAFIALQYTLAFNFYSNTGPR